MTLAGRQVHSVRSVALGDGRIELFAVGTERAVWRNVHSDRNAAFAGWESLGSSADQVWATVEQDGRALLVVRQTTGELWLLRQPRVGSRLA